jgi:hypothetical protein
VIHVFARRVVVVLCLLAAAAPVARAADPTPSGPSSTGSPGTAGDASVLLRWTSPGDDDHDGTAFRYDLRWSDRPITPATFMLANPVLGIAPPAPAGTPESCEVTGLAPDRLYYFAIRTQDQSGNWSTISNVVSRWSSRAGSSLQQASVWLSPPAPNPSRGNFVQFVLTLPYDQRVIVDVIDLGGRLVRTLAASVYPAGPTVITWPLDDSRGRRLATGTYWVRLRAANREIVHRLAVGG